MVCQRPVGSGDLSLELRFMGGHFAAHHVRLRQVIQRAELCSTDFVKDTDMHFK